MNARIAVASGFLALCPALVGATGDASKPPDTVVVVLGSKSVELWPYTGTDFSGSPADPVNLFFLNTDPRALRQALLALDGNRPPIAPVPLPFDDCTWIDGMGYEQTAWAERRGWVGSEIQLACTHPGSPLGDPFRFHLRLFLQGRHTIGAAHFEILVPGTAEHEVLSWDFARAFVEGEMGRVGGPGASSEVVPLLVPGSFRAVRRPVYDALVGAGLGPLLGMLGLSTGDTDAQGNPNIPMSGDAVAFSPHLHFRPKSGHTHAATTIDYGVVAPKPFCATGPYDLVLLQGPVHLEQRVSTDRRGRYARMYKIEGELTVTPWDPVNMMPAGPPIAARVREQHVARLTNRHGQVYERSSRELLSDPAQSLAWVLAAGDIDHYRLDLQCGP